MLTYSYDERTRRFFVYCGNSTAVCTSALLLAFALCGSSQAQQSEQTQQTDEILVSVRKQTALDSEAISFSSTPDAEPHLQEGTSIVAGLGALYSPVYDGANKSKVSPFPYIDIHGLFNDRIYVSAVRGLGVNIVDDGPFRAGLALNYRPGRTSSDSDRLKGLPDISGAPSIRGFLTYSIKPVAFELSVKDEFGSKPSTEVTLSASIGFAATPRMHLSLGANLSWVDSRYSRKYFGITPTDAAHANADGNPLSAYAPGSGLSTVGLTSTGIYALTPHWAIATRVGFQDLIGAPAKDSPLTQRTFGASVGVGALYRFK